MKKSAQNFWRHAGGPGMHDTKLNMERQVDN